MAGKQEQLEVNRRVVAGWAIAIIVVTSSAAFVSTRIARARPNGPLEVPPREAGARPQPGVLDAQLFDQSGWSIVQERNARTYLESYGWNDPGHRTAHIPITRAKQLLLARGGPDGGR